MQRVQNGSNMNNISIEDNVMINSRKDTYFVCLTVFNSGSVPHYPSQKFVAKLY